MRIVQGELSSHLKPPAVPCYSFSTNAAILVPTPPAGARGDFVKLGARRYLVISIVMAAAVLAADEAGAIAHARVAVGACSAVAQQLPLLEQALLGQPLAAAPDLVEAAHFSQLAPIDDVRASGAFVPTAVADGTAEMVASPADFSASSAAIPAMAPEFGQHTEQILLELGYDWDRIARLREHGAIA